MKIVQNASIENFSSKEKLIDILFKILHLIVNYHYAFVRYYTYFQWISQFMTMTHVDVLCDQHLTTVKPVLSDLPREP